MLGARVQSVRAQSGVAGRFAFRNPLDLLRISLPQRPAWWWIGLYAAVNLPLIGWTLYVNLLVHDVPPDWWILSALPQQLRDGTLYADGTYFRWSPVAAWALATVVPIGMAAWALLHFLPLLLIRDRRLIALTLCSWAFWMDLSMGNLFIAVFVTGLIAWRGSFTAGIAFIALTLLMPRPVQLPLLAALLWTRPGLRWPFVSMLVAHTALVWVSGMGEEWLAMLMVTSSGEAGLPFPINSSPSAFLGPELWMVIAVPSAVVLARRGRIGWAGLMLSPYWLAQYWLMPLMDVNRRDSM